MPRRSSPRTAPPAVDVTVEAGAWPPRSKLARLAAGAVAAAAKGAGFRAAGGEVSLVFTDDAHIRRLNRRYRGKNKATNVLSFPAAPVGNGAVAPLLGDIVLAAETVAGEAAAGGIPSDHHLTHLIVHGFLHLIGYDHEDEDEAAAMEALEIRVLKKLGIADPYAVPAATVARRAR